MRIYTSVRDKKYFKDYLGESFYLYFCHLRIDNSSYLFKISMWRKQVQKYGLADL